MKTMKPIIWKMQEPLQPSDFPCLICSDLEATMFVTFGKGGAYTLPVCWKCSQLSEDELLAKIKPKDKENKQELSPLKKAILQVRGEAPPKSYPHPY